MEVPTFDPRPEWDRKKYDKYSYFKRRATALGGKWQKMRKNKLIQNPFCETCGLMAQEVHHILPRHTHPQLTYEWTNLQSLCHKCHMEIHR